MTATDFLMNIVSNEHLAKYPFRYCLASDLKIPYTVEDTVARPNNSGDFVELEKLIECKSLDNYSGIGISIQASNISAIDVDKCFTKEFDLSSADDRAKDIIKMFENDAYIEFSFSGKGLRIFFKTQEPIKDYSLNYYTKNARTGCEFYQPSGSARYVTITGKTICDNSLFLKNSLLLKAFLDKYMKKEIKRTISNYSNIDEIRTFDELLKVVKRKYLTDIRFQELWFDNKHYQMNAMSQESENDFRLLQYLYSYITQDKELLRQIFEASPYFKSKDNKHLQKWTYNNYRYYNYVYDHLN